MKRVAIIGAGRVGAALALRLEHAGHAVLNVAGRSPSSTSLARFTELVPGANVVGVAQAPIEVDLVLVTTPDDQIAHVAGLAARADTIPMGQRWVHTSGGHGVEVLRVARAAGARVAACHPAMTIPGPVAGATRLSGASWAVTAQQDELGWAEELVRDLGGRPVPVEGKDRALYHTALSVGANGTTAVVALARDLLLGAGVTDPAPFLGPLTTAAAQGAATDGLQALTGPVSRGDAGTVRRHMDELRTSFPEAIPAYVVLCDLLLSQAARAGLDPDGLRRVRAALDELST